jgi:hypothetical protein
MKTRILFYTALASVHCTLLSAQAQVSPKMPIDEVSKLITYTDVVEEPGMNKDSLYNRTMRWFKSYFKNPLEAIKKSDPEARIIEGGYRFTIKRPEPGSKKQPAPMVDAGLVNYKLKVMCKDGKFKYEVTSMSWKQTSYYPIERWMDTEAKNYDPNFALFLQQTDEFVKSMIKSLETAIETDPAVKKDDW